MKKIVLLILSLTLLSTTAFARPELTLGRPVFSGSGCPYGRASASLSPDNTKLSVIFDEYFTETNVRAGQSFSKKNCNITVPVKLPQGYSISIFKIDYRGFSAVAPSSGSYGQFWVKYFFDGNERMRRTRTFRPGFENDYLFTNYLEEHQLVWSRCGKKTDLKAHTKLKAYSTSGRDDTFITLDTMDVDSGLDFHIKWRSCN